MVCSRTRVEHNKRKKARPFLGKKPGKSFSHNIFSSLVSGGGGVDPHAVFTSLRSDGQQSLGPALTAFTDRPADVGDVAAEELVPARPQDLRAVIVKARFVTLSWRSAGDDVTAYSVYWRQEGSPRERVHNTTRSKLEEANIGESPRPLILVEKD